MASIDEEHGKCADVIIPRQDLIDKNEQIDTLEHRIAEQHSEFQYQIQQIEISQLEKMNKMHDSYSIQIKDLNQTKSQMEISHMEQINILTVSIAESKDTHFKDLHDIECKFNEKIICEFDKSVNMKSKMDVMREDYEKLLRKSAGYLEETVEGLEGEFKVKLHESQDLIRQLMKEIECKKSEFVQYCNQLSVENDRRIVQMKIVFEKKLKDENELMQKWRADAGVLNKKLSTVSLTCNNLEKEMAVLQGEHAKNKQTIRQLDQDVEELRREVKERNQALLDKQVRFDELLGKNHELEKYREILIKKNNALRAQIEPREHDVQEKKHQIIDMENELENLEENNVRLQLKTAQLKEKCQATEIELKRERDKYTATQALVSKICRDIHYVSRCVQDIAKLKREIIELNRR